MIKFVILWILVWMFWNLYPISNENGTRTYFAQNENRDEDETPIEAFEKLSPLDKTRLLQLEFQNPTCSSSISSTDYQISFRFHARNYTVHPYAGIAGPNSFLGLKLYEEADFRFTVRGCLKLVIPGETKCDHEWTFTKENWTPSFVNKDNFLMEYTYSFSRPDIDTRKNCNIYYDEMTVDIVIRGISQTYVLYAKTCEKNQCFVIKKLE